MDAPGDREELEAEAEEIVGGRLVRWALRWSPASGHCRGFDDGNANQYAAAQVLAGERHGRHVLHHDELDRVSPAT